MPQHSNKRPARGTSGAHRHASAQRRSTAVQNSAAPFPASAQPRSRSRFAPFVLVALLVVAAFAVGIFAFRACSAVLFPTATTSSSSTPYVSPYDWNNLSTANNRYSYSVDGVTQSKLGIDVSDNQGSIDWRQVAGDGIQFAIIRAGYRGTTEGNIYVDANFADNLQGAQAAGLQTGVYFFSQATTEDEAREEADFVIKNLAGAKLAYPIVFDAESGTSSGTRTSGLTRDQMTTIAQAFCARVQAAGYSAAIYGNAQDLSRYTLSTLQQSYPVWFAEYGAGAAVVRLHHVAVCQQRPGGRHRYRR